MKTVGIIGGLSPESTIKYYQWLNEGVQQKLGGQHSAKILLSSVDFGEFTALKEKGDWDTQGSLLADKAKNLEKAGADFIILATNTMHKVADSIIDAIKIPFLHLADATADKIVDQNITTIGLLGTIYTMEQDFYKDRLKKQGITPYVPEYETGSNISDIIYNELCHGVINEHSKEYFRQTIKALNLKGADGIILGCTEITTLINQDDLDLPVFDTTKIHVERALEEIFS